MIDLKPLLFCDCIDRYNTKREVAIAYRKQLSVQIRLIKVSF